ncbi:hypothetical protein GMO_03150 [Gluconobacter morbifer G707]|uniref:Uncharacterized protein n=1 Tax=Gluconobacter morbifer G707 TaxID=1088869 RepID=G6XFQ0_9PROT|nr:hypothetical protein GMO_03150 [Gluconobacter morbifer G707]
MVKDITRELNDIWNLKIPERDTIVKALSHPLIQDDTRSQLLSDIASRICSIFMESRLLYLDSLHMYRRRHRFALKSRLFSKWGEGVRFWFGRGHEHDSYIICLVWNDRNDPLSIHAAFLTSPSEVLALCPEKNRKYSFRITLKALRDASARSRPRVSGMVLPE